MTKPEDSQTIHVPVMSDEVKKYLKLPEGGCAVDCTLGLAGHAVEIVKTIGPKGRFVGIDRDEESLALAAEQLKDFGGQSDLIYDDFCHLAQILKRLEIREVDGMLFDLGISSFQLNNPQRGFSIKSEGPLDMRMDQQAGGSAYDLINSLSEKEISRILKEYGEERWHNRIARCLVNHRAKTPIASTKDLTDLVLKAVPYKYQRDRIHPATRTFQAIRIAVNRELEALEAVLEQAIGFLRVGGRLCVISFHSLEDRIVKNKFRQAAKEGTVDLIVKKPIRPTEEETIKNPRSRSARLRVVERTP